MQLTSTNVETVFNKCLYTEGEDTTGHIRADGILNNVGFNPVRLEENKANIASMLEDLPVSFYQNTGGGMSFLNFVLNKAEEQWTDMHGTAEMLLLLGLAIGELEYCLPREMWGILPGSMPYLVIKENNNEARKEAKEHTNA